MFLHEETVKGKKEDDEVKTKRQQEKRPDVWRRAKPARRKEGRKSRTRASDTPRFHES